VLALDAGEGELSLIGSIVILVAIQAGLLLVGYLFVYRPNALAALPRFPGPDPAGAVRSGLGWGALAWLGSTIVAALVVALLEAIGRPPEAEAAERAIAQLDPILVVLAVVVLAPIAEELFFRGIVFNAWLREGGRRWAYIGSAALFAAVHLSLVTALPIFLLGLALAWVYERRRSLLAPIVMHATVNAISVTIALLARYDVIRLPTT
jgi:membrane protease YdiL (CAAX protease family)